MATCRMPETLLLATKGSSWRSRDTGYSAHRRHARIEARRSISPPAASTQGSSTSTTVVPTGGREFLSLFPPFFMRTTTFEEFRDGLYGLTQPLALGSSGFDVKLRMTVARLGDGSLLLCGPIAPTDEMLSIIEALDAPVKHIIIPNSSPEHWYFAPALAAKFPRATVWTVQGFWEGKRAPFPPFGLRKLRETSVCKVLGVDPLPAELQGEVEAVTYEALRFVWFVEAAIILPRYKALLLSDTALELSETDYADLSERFVNEAKKLGVWGTLGPSVTKVTFLDKPKEGRAWVDAVLQHDFDMVIVGHGSAPTPNGKAAFRECYDFLF